MMKKKFLLLLPFYCATTNTMLQQGAKTFVLPIYNGAKQSLGKTISSTFSVLCPQERIIEAKIKVCLNILGLPEDATSEQIKAQYFKLAKECHPDVNKEPGSEEKFKKINNAYEFLIGKLEELPGQGAGVSMGGGASTEEFKDDSPDKNNVKNNNKEDGEQKKQGEQKFKDNSQDKNNDKNDNPKSNRFNSKNIKNMGKGAFLAALGYGMINDDLLKRLQRKYIDENILNDILNDDNKQKKYFKDMFEDMELIILSNAQKILFFNELYKKYKDSNINKNIISNIFHVKLLCEKVDLFIAQEKKSINNNMSIRNDIQQLLNGLSKDFLFTSMIEELCRKDYDNKDINLYELTLIYDITRRSKYCCL